MSTQRYAVPELSQRKERFVQACALAFSFIFGAIVLVSLAVYGSVTTTGAFIN